ncbi:glycosyltransferase [Halosquirtibacter laminarini]|uniref:Glycosyltransferase n=1 Tax=Halosquirtibacter laminarini TaxID=3374600 RepID=A0AC61NBR9_9BACT|nr:glycosyltransferase [Prolixibacteraceae bacterium]
MKKILHVIGGMNRAGAETMLMNIYRAIDRSEYQFDFVYYTKVKCDYDDEIYSLGGKVFYARASNLVVNVFDIYKLIRKNGPYVAVHSHTLLNIGYSMIAASLAGVKIRIAHSHNTQNFIKPNLFQKLYEKSAKVLVYTFANQYICCGREAGEYLFPNQSHVTFIPNSINFDSFTDISQTSCDELSQSLDIKSNEHVLIQVGRLSEVKNFSFSIDVCSELKRREVAFKFLIVGSGHLEAELKNKVNQLGLQDNIKFLGIRTDIPVLFKVADLFLMPSYHEGFPVVLVESQVAGLYSLVSDNVSSEVDRGVGLVSFNSLKLNEWTELVLDRFTNKCKNIDTDYLEKLSDFNIDNSVKMITTIYDK